MEHIEFDGAADTGPMLLRFLKEVEGFCLGRGIQFRDVDITSEMETDDPATVAQLIRTGGPVIADDDSYTIRLRST